MPIRILALDELPDSLVHRFAAGDGVIWTGAGVSSRSTEVIDGSAVRVGAPSGGRLLKRLKDSTNKPHPEPATLAEVAGLYALQKGRDRLNRLIKCVYGSKSLIAPRFYDLIAQLPSAVRIFITTNYEPFLENALHVRRPTLVVKDHGLAEVTHTRPVVYKPHGDAQTPAESVITTAD